MHVSVKNAFSQCPIDYLVYCSERSLGRISVSAEPFELTHVELRRGGQATAAHAAPTGLQYNNNRHSYARAAVPYHAKTILCLLCCGIHDDFDFTRWVKVHSFSA